MAFGKDLSKLITKQWSYSNTYTFQFVFSEFMKSQTQWNEDSEGRDINLYIVNAETPDFTNNPIEIITGGQYRIHNGKDQLYRFAVTFRDYNQLYLYRKFLTMYRLQQSTYFDDLKMTVIITKDADYYNETDKLLMTLEDTMIEGVSNISNGNNGESQIAEFTVRFKSMSPNIVL